MPNNNSRSPDRYTNALRFAPVPYAPPRSVQRTVDRELSRGVESAATVEAAAYVTHTALNLVALLSEAEASLAQATPEAADRYAAIVDTYTAVALGEVANLARPRYRGYGA